MSKTSPLSPFLPSAYAQCQIMPVWITLSEDYSFRLGFKLLYISLVCILVKWTSGCLLGPYWKIKHPQNINQWEWQLTSSPLHNILSTPLTLTLIYCLSPHLVAVSIFCGGRPPLSVSQWLADSGVSFLHVAVASGRAIYQLSHPSIG